MKDSHTQRVAQVDINAVAMPSAPTSYLRIYGVVLSVGVFCAIAIVTVYATTQPIIAKNRVILREKAILKVLPGATSSRVFQVAEEVKLADQADKGNVVFAGFDEQGSLVGIAIETQGMGYQDTIRLLYGYSFEKQAIVGISVLEMRETPGLGDRIETDEDFQKNFVALDVTLNDEETDLLNPIEFVKPGKRSKAWQVDGISGATISSRAVAQMLKASAEKWIPLIHAHEKDFQDEGDRL